MSTAYTVEPGDTLSSIAKKFSIPDWRTIYNTAENRAFRLKRPNPDHIFRGDVLMIPDTSPGVTSAVLTPAVSTGPKSTDPKTVAESVKNEPIRWLLSAVSQLEGFQKRLPTGLSSIPFLDDLPREVLRVHFHIDSPETEPIKLNRIITNYKEMLKVISTQSGTVFRSATDEEAKAANKGKIPRAWTDNRNFGGGAIHFTSVYVTQKLACQQAVMVHESMHFVEPEPGPGLPDISEADPKYDDVSILPPDKTIHNPSSYAAGAFHLANGVRKRDFCL